jgi:hypothetical protein
MKNKITAPIFAIIFVLLSVMNPAHSESVSADQEAFETLSRLLPYGRHLGRNSYGEFCSVHFSRYPNGEHFFSITSVDVRGDTRQMMFTYQNNLKDPVLNDVTGAFDGKLTLIESISESPDNLETVIGSISVRDFTTVKIINQTGKNECTID